jgi:superfamily II DNA or RNA helicase
MIPITERFLMDTGGWQAMKHAKALWEMSRVVSAHYAAPVLRGVVRDGNTEYRAGLKINTYTNVENICSCRESREWGTICAHSLAVGLAVIRPKQEPSRAPEPRSAEPETLPRLRSDGEGELIELHLVLPPNIESGLERNQITLGFEVVIGGRRILASALPKDRPYRCDPADLAVLKVARRWSGQGLPGMVVVDREQFFELLGALPDHPRVTIARRQAVRISPESVRPRLRVEQRPDGGVHLTTTAPRGRLWVGKKSCWILDTDCWMPVAPGLPPHYFPVLETAISLDAEQAAGFYAHELPTLSNFFQMDSSMGVDSTELAEVPVQATIQPGTPEIYATFEGSLNFLNAKIQCLYGKRMVTLGATSQKERFTYQTEDGLRTRNLEVERECQIRLEASGFTGPSATGDFVLKGQNAILNFAGAHLPQLEKIWKISIGSRFGNISEGIERVAPRLAVVGSGVDWFEVTFGLESDRGDRFSAAEVHRLLHSGQSYTKLKDGRLAVFDPANLMEFEEILRDCDPTQLQAGRYRIPRNQAGFLDGAFRELTGAEIRTDTAWEHWTRAQQQLVPLAAIPLGSLDGILRPYQKEGVNWLHFLASNRLGGILADEMGLGKTLQTLAFLRSSMGIPAHEASSMGLPAHEASGMGIPAHEVSGMGIPAHEHGLQARDPGFMGGDAHATRPMGKHAHATQQAPSLVICPSSLVFNWIREAERFTPEIKVLAIEGANRSSLFARIPETELIVTSYPLLRRDIDAYRAYEFGTVVLDEATHIKNPDTQNTQAALALRARHRFVLTGTPVENSVRDLWSIMQFVLPGYLGSREEFRERYELPISRGSAAERARLARKLRPVMLRRLKRDVVKDLPEKLLQTALCDLTAEQAELYSRIHRESRRKIEDLAGERNAGKVRLAMLTALLRLRQVCCDLRLVGQAGSQPSGKLDLLEELLEEALDGGHRVLVFSQFVAMLTLIRQQLDEGGINYCYLDGSTRDRAAEIDRFQGSDDVPVFLISLKAGGTGLNLSAADTVVHFDPWWNPAVEDQATDRAHRIGQTRVVTAYKLIARGTVEEKILALQQKKREVIDATIDSEEPSMTGLTTDELRELLVAE